MAEQFVCVHCNKYVKELHRRYTPNVIKLHSCEHCHKIADKYIEYDQVVVLIDLCLFNREAYRHVLFNTTFKNHWKLAIIILLLKTYCQWVNLSTDLFGLGPSYINTEHSFYLSAVIAGFGAAVNIAVLCSAIFTYELLSKSKVTGGASLLVQWKAVVLSSMSWFLLLPSLIWKQHIPTPVNFFLFAAYFIISQTQALSVTCSSPRPALFAILLISLSVEAVMLLKAEYIINDYFLIT